MPSQPTTVTDSPVKRWHFCSCFLVTQPRGKKGIDKSLEVSGGSPFGILAQLRLLFFFFFFWGCRVRKLLDQGSNLRHSSDHSHSWILNLLWHQGTPRLQLLTERGMFPVNDNGFCPCSEGASEPHRGDCNTLGKAP